jgi:hypothetical protein
MTNPLTAPFANGPESMYNRCWRLEKVWMCQITRD